METKQNEVLEGLVRSAEIVELIGNLTLKNGKTIKESIALKDISLWSVAEPDIALHVIPTLLYDQPYLGDIKKKLYMHLRCIKYYIRNVYLAKKKRFKKIETDDHPNKWLILGFTNYIYRDTLNPLVEKILAYESSIKPIKIDHNLESREPFDNVLINPKKELAIALKKFNKEISNLFEALRKNGLTELSLNQNILSKSQFLFIFDWLFKVCLPRLCFDILLAEKYITLISPRIIISGDMADARNRIYTLFAKKINIPVLDLQFGAYNESSVEWRFPLSDKIAVWGEYFTDLFTRFHKIPSDQIEIVGSPRFDYLTESKPAKSQNIRKKKNETSSKVILFASIYTSISSYDSRYNPSLIEEFKVKLVEIASTERDKLSLYIKPHPLEDLQWLHNIKHLQDNIHLIPASDDIRDHIPNCDIFITYGSTATFDALLMHKIIFSADIEGLIWWDDIFLRKGVTIPIDNYDKLKELVTTGNLENYNDKLQDKKLAFINSMVYQTENFASLRIISLAKKMISKNKLI